MEDYDSLPLEQNHRLGIRHWNDRRFFPAHEAWESAWKQAKDQAPDETDFFKGLSQLGAGYVHLLRGNQHGAYTLLRRGAGRILKYEDGHRGVDVRKVAAAVLSHALYIELAERAGRPSVDLDPPKI